MASTSNDSCHLSYSFNEWDLFTANTWYELDQYDRNNPKILTGTENWALVLNGPGWY